MSAPDLAEAGRLIAEARRLVAKLRRLPEAARPRSPAEGYLAQEAAARLLGPLAGWKVAATNAAAQAAMGTSEPVAGRLPRSALAFDPASFAGAFAAPQIECEFAFRIGARLAPGPAPATREALAAHVDAILPALEIVDQIFLDRALAGLPSLIAGSTVAGCVVGEPIAEWRDLDLRALAAELYVGGAWRAAGSGATVLGDPFEALLWLAEHLRGRGLALEAGDIVISGSCTGLTAVGAGVEILADFGPLGSVRAAIGPLAPALELSVP